MKNHVTAFIKPILGGGVFMYSKSLYNLLRKLP